MNALCCFFHSEPRMLAVILPRWAPFFVPAPVSLYGKSRSHQKIQINLLFYHVLSCADSFQSHYLATFIIFVALFLYSFVFRTNALEISDKFHKQQSVRRQTVFNCICPILLMHESGFDQIIRVMWNGFEVCFECFCDRFDGDPLLSLHQKKDFNPVVVSHTAEMPLHLFSGF